jgi:predicted nucleic acid-binding protein
VSATATSSTAAYLIDTNILLRSIEHGHPMQPIALQALQRLVLSGASLCIAPQNLIEFWAVATRPPAANGLGLTPVQAATELMNFKTVFQVLPDISAIFTEWERIAVVYAVSGKQAHDARLVAILKAHGIGNLMTFNVGDFTRYAAGEGISIVDPSGIPSTSP